MWLAGAEVAAKALTFLAFAHLGRVAGPAGLGYIEFAVAAALCAGLVIDLGFNPYGAREIARAPERTRALVREIVAARVGLAAAAIGIIACLALIPDQSSMRTRILLVYGLSLVPMPFFLNWVFQGHEQMGTVAVATVLRQGVFAATVFGFVREVTELWIVAAGEVAGVACAVAYCLWVYRRRFGRPDAEGQPVRRWFSRRLFREGVPIGLGQMFWAARMFAGTIILGLIASDADVGFFGSAQRILVAVHTFVWLYYFNLLPSMTRAWNGGHGALAGLVDRSLRWVWWVGAGAALVGVMTADRIMAVVYGSDFAAAGPILCWFAGVCLILAVSGHYRFGLIAAGKQTTEMLSAAVGAGLAVVLIPLGYLFGGGLSAAAGGLFVAEAVVWAITWWYGRRLLDLRGHVRHLVRPGLAALVAAALAAALPGARSTVRVILVTVVFLGLACATDGAVRIGVRDALLSIRRGGRGAPGAA